MNYYVSSGMLNPTHTPTHQGLSVHHASVLCHNEWIQDDAVFTYEFITYDIAQ